MQWYCIKSDKNKKYISRDGASFYFNNKPAAMAWYAAEKDAHNMIVYLNTCGFDKLTVQEHEF